MKLRNNWKVKNKQWDKFVIKLRISYIDFFSLEIDITRDFYMVTVFNLCIKNR
jgi:hypothetical protein